MKPWWKFQADLAMASFEAQRVIGLRLLKLAAGGPGAAVESERMITEKIGASAEAAATLMMGGSTHKVLRRYRQIMQANARRLSRSKR